MMVRITHNTTVRRAVPGVIAGIAAVISLFLAAEISAGGPAGIGSGKTPAAIESEQAGPWSVGDGPAASEPSEYTPANALGQFRYLVTFDEPGLLERHRAGRMTAAGFDMDTPEMQDARDLLIARQSAHRQAMASELGRTVTASHHYLVTHSGMAVWLTPDEAGRVESLPDVVSVERERQYQHATDRGPWFIGADSLWDGSAAPQGTELRGEGMVIGVLDTGIDSTHPSFQNDPACGHGDALQDKVLSALDCSSTDTEGLCNGTDPVDGHGHGSHTASTAGGNRLEPADTSLPDPMSGVAPCAHIRAYKVCPTSSCPGSYTLAGMDSVLIHGDVDVMNYSISGGSDPWNDGDRRKLDLVAAGVMVAASAGNTSAQVPIPVGEVNHLGPWVLTTAASTDDSESMGLLSAAGPGDPPLDTQEISARPGSDSPASPVIADMPIRHFDGQDSSAEGCTAGEDDAPGDLEPFPAEFFDGAAALIQRGTCPFTTKIANAFNAGAEFVVIRNNESGSFGMITEGQPEVPAYSISFAPGEALQSFVSSNPDTATIDFQPIPGDVLASFSFRGPTPEPLHNLTKPDITAPGVNIVAAIPGGLANVSGTSMSSPHIAGAAALVRQARPDWTPPEVMSALMTTAWQDGRKDGVIEPLTESWDADDVGSGRVDLTRAARAGLVLDEVFANYQAAYPATGGDVRTLNTPSLREVHCTPACTWTRRVENTLDEPVTWTATGEAEDILIQVSPAEFSFSGEPGETQELTISASPLGDQAAEVVFGEVSLTPSGGQAPEQHLTVAVRGEGNAALNLHPAAVDVVLAGDGSAQETLSVANVGTVPLDWTLGYSDTGADCTGDAPGWLDAAPQSGAIGPGEAPADVQLDFDAAGLAPGEYDTLLCIESNDPGTPQAFVPVTLEVLGDVPAADIAPPGLLFQVPAGEIGVAFLSVANTGQSTLEWEIGEYIDEILLDGGFEAGTPNPFWQEESTNFDTPLCTEAICSGTGGGTGPFEGEWWAWFGGMNSADETGFVAQNVTMPDSDQVELRFRLEIPLAFTTATFRASLEGETLFEVTDADAGDYAQYTQVSVDVSAFADGLTRHLRFTGQTEEGGTTNIFLDDVRLLERRCDDPDDIAWLHVDGDSGTVQSGGNTTVAISTDAAALEQGTYIAELCVITNDPLQPVAEVPVTLQVVHPDTLYRDSFEEVGP